MNKPDAPLSVKDLNAIDARLNRSFYAAVAAVLIYLALIVFGSSFIKRPAGTDAPWIALIILFSFLLTIAGYIWYVVAIGLTTRALGKPAVLYIVWLLAAPPLSLIPIPFVSAIIGASPLAIKFIISGDIRTRIRFQTLRDLHS